jgi:hypothetical protein
MPGCVVVYTAENQYKTDISSSKGGGIYLFCIIDIAAILLITLSPPAFGGRG